MNRKNINRIHAILATAMMCQDFVLEDQELMQSNLIKDNLDNPDFWYEMGETTLCAIEGFIVGHYRKNSPSNIDFLFDTNNRIEINDLIIQSITTALKNAAVED